MLNCKILLIPFLLEHRIQKWKFVEKSCSLLLFFFLFLLKTFSFLSNLKWASKINKCNIVNRMGRDRAGSGSEGSHLRAKRGGQFHPLRLWGADLSRRWVVVRASSLQPHPRAPPSDETEVRKESKWENRLWQLRQTGFQILALPALSYPCGDEQRFSLIVSSIFLCSDYFRIWSQSFGNYKLKLYY